MTRKSSSSSVAIAAASPARAPRARRGRARAGCSSRTGGARDWRRCRGSCARSQRDHPGPVAAAAQVHRGQPAVVVHVAAVPAALALGHQVADLEPSPDAHPRRARPLHARPPQAELARDQLPAPRRVDQPARAERRGRALRLDLDGVPGGAVEGHVHDPRALAQGDPIDLAHRAQVVLELAAPHLIGRNNRRLGRSNLGPLPQRLAARPAEEPQAVLRQVLGVEVRFQIEEGRQVVRPHLHARLAHLVAGLGQRPAGRLNHRDRQGRRLAAQLPGEGQAGETAAAHDDVEALRVHGGHAA